MNRFDIYTMPRSPGAVAGIEDRGSSLRLPQIAAGGFPISGQAYRGTPFFISDEDSDFPATGLKKSCFIHDEKIIELSLDVFIKRRGQLAGDLLARFRSHSGI
jgi:hypothetical protein